MKNQNDLIISISVGVVAVIVALVIIFTAPQASKPADPTPVDVSAPKLPVADVVFTNGLSGGGSLAGGSPFGGPGMSGKPRMMAGARGGK